MLTSAICNYLQCGDNARTQMYQGSNTALKHACIKYSTLQLTTHGIVSNIMWYVAMKYITNINMNGTDMVLSFTWSQQKQVLLLTSALMQKEDKDKVSYNSVHALVQTTEYEITAQQHNICWTSWL